MKALVPFALLLCMLTGCASYEEHAAKRTEQLRKIYPAGMSREEVQAKWENRKPAFTASRPANGWNAYPNQYLAKAVIDRETKTGQTIETVERYLGHDGWSLCNCWYYYDSSSKLVDAEWEFKSD